MIFFSGAVGRAVRLEDRAAEGSLRLVDMKDDQISYEEHKSIITRLVLSQRVNAQFTHSLGGEVYIYVFGDRIGGLTLSGLSFAATCEDESPEHGLERTLQWYKERKASARQDPITVVVGETAFNAFLLEMQTDVVDPSSGMVQWNANMTMLTDREK